MPLAKTINIFFVLCLLLLTGCASTSGNPKITLSEERVVGFVQKMSDDMEQKSIKEFSSNFSADFVYEDDVTTPNSIKWGYKQYLQQVAQLMNRASKIESETAIRNISVKGEDSASVMIEQTTRITFQGRTQESRSIQRSNIIQKNGQLLLQRTEMLKDLGHEVL